MGFSFFFFFHCFAFSFTPCFQMQAGSKAMAMMAEEGEALLCGSLETTSNASYECIFHLQRLVMAIASSNITILWPTYQVALKRTWSLTMTKCSRLQMCLICSHKGCCSHNNYDFHGECDKASGDFNVSAYHAYSRLKF